MPKLGFAALGQSLTELPGYAKVIGIVLTASPVAWALVGIGWAGFQSPRKLDAHIAQLDTIRVEQAHRDSALLAEMRESNRLSRCNLKFVRDTDRLRCAVE